MRTVVHSTALLTSPQLHAPVSGLVWSGESVMVAPAAAGFLQVLGPEAQGFVLAAACEPLALGQAGGVPSGTNVVQPVSLYAQPVPGQQQLLADTKIVLLPDEPLLVLGQEQQFALVQRPNGALGFVPSVLCSNMPQGGSGAMHLGLSIAWVMRGFVWSFFNLVGVAAVITSDLVARGWRGPLGLALVGGVGLALMLLGRPRLLARSFASGMLIFYLLMHIFSGGTWTLWK